MTMIGPRAFLEQTPVQIDAALDGGIADGVNADLKPEVVSRPHASVDLCFLQGHETALGGTIGERFAHVRRAAAERAVGEDLEPTDPSSSARVVQR